jgi:hypothetical protein
MLICWLTDCPAAVRKFLEIDGVVDFLLTLVSAAPGMTVRAGICFRCSLPTLTPQPSRASSSNQHFQVHDEDNRTVPVTDGLTLLLLGTCLTSNDNSNEQLTRQSFMDIIRHRIGVRIAPSIAFRRLIPQELDSKKHR